MLAKRLARHGLAVTGGTLAAVSSQSASASVPASVMSSTINAANLFAAGQTAATGAISVKAAALTEGVLKTMLLSKLKMAMAVLLVASTAAFTCGVLATRQQPLPPGAVQAKSQTKPVEPPKEDKSKLQGNHRQVARASKDDLKLLNGSWKVVALEADGRKAPSLALKGMRWSFKGSEVQMADPGDKSGSKASVKIDSSKTPKHIDFVVLEGSLKGKTLQGIFTFDEDRLVICLRDPKAAEKGRPKEFKTEADSGLGMITLERVPPSKKGEQKKKDTSMLEVRLNYVKFQVSDNKPSAIGISTNRYYAELDDRGNLRKRLPLAANVEVLIDGKKARITDLLPGDKIALRLTRDHKSVAKIELSLKPRLAALEKEAEVLRKRIKRLEEIK